VNLTGAIEEYARRKVEKVLRFFDRVQQVDVLIDRVRNGYSVEILTDVEHHEPFVSVSSHPDLYACIDVGVDKTVRQLTDHKTRLRNNKHLSTMRQLPNETA
jgi:ribosomal subunit interface protein